MAMLETTTVLGALRGVPSGNPDVSVFKGIPFAAPPTGDLRWREPQPATPWEGVRDASSFAPVCPQTDFEPGSFYDREFYHALAASPMSEDCLYLNIWTPAASKGEKLPVLFWIHGGGFVHGAGSEFPFDGNTMAKRGVLLVTFNYRLGVLGFFAHPALSAASPTHASGNVGLLDQLAALAWVRDNIAAFGGDPDRITVFGQSAGAMSVQVLLASPLARGMMAGAILQSGGGFFLNNRSMTLRKAEQDGKKLMKTCGVDTIEKMRALPVEALFDGVRTLQKESRGRAPAMGPLLDGHLIPQDPSKAICAGEASRIPILAGSLADEGNALGGSRDITLAMAAGSCVLAAVWPHITDKPAWHYHFTRKAPGDEYGAFHSAELWYVFGTQSRAWRPWEPIDAELSERMVGYWTRFAATGDPNGEGLPGWPAFTDDAPLTLEIGETTAPFRIGQNAEIQAVADKVTASLPG